MTTTRHPVILDDTHPSINYRGKWFQESGSADRGNFGPAYRSSLHGTRDNSSFSFSFVGKEVVISGSLIDGSSVNEPSWECTVDGRVVGAGANNANQHNMVLCMDDSSPEGQHEIIVTITNKRPDEYAFWLDKIQYFPAESVNVDDEVIIVDSTDPGLRAALGKGWAGIAEVANITRSAESEFSYKFRGVSVSWYGFIPAEMSRIQTFGSYAIDGGPDTDFLIQASPGVGATQYNMKIFETVPVPPGEHTLVVKYKGTAEDIPLVMDYLMIQNAPEVGRTNPSSSSSSVSPRPSGGGRGGSNGGAGSNGDGSGGGGDSGGISGGDSAGGQISNGQPPGSGSGPNIGAIVGGVLGGLAFLILLLALLWRIRSRRRRKMEQGEEVGNGVEARASPFPYPVDAKSYGELHPSWNKSRAQTSTSGAAASHIQTSSVSGSSSTTTPSSGRRLLVHEDSGVRIPGPEAARASAVEELPPRYTAS